MRLARDRAERHRARGEALDDLRRPARPRSSGIGSASRNAEQRRAASRAARVSAFTALRVRLVRLAPSSSGRRAAAARSSPGSTCGARRRAATRTGRHRQQRVRRRRGSARACRASDSSASAAQADAADPRRRAGEVAVDELGREARPPRRSARRSTTGSSRSPSSTSSSAGPWRCPSSRGAARSSASSRAAASPSSTSSASVSSIRYGLTAAAP